ncbi:MAG: ATP-binding cassette domain-containing protein [Gudongella sp.]|nr:ATP-binding cassette domain-containing protein [Gudongella sp.]
MKRGDHALSVILRTEDLSKHYIIKGGAFAKRQVIQAAKKVSFQVMENESLGLIGESGSGKSTIANLILRLTQPSEGRIELFGVDVTSLKEEEMRRYRKDIQIIFQYTNDVLDPQMTVDELLKEPLKIHRIVKDSEMDQEVARLLEQVGLSPSERWKLPGQLSGGQNQRIIIARAIATRAKLIVCDEPVSALDVSVQGQILNLLIRLKEELNLSYLFISHDLKVIRHMCDKIAVMKDGEIVEMGDTEDVLNNPRHEYTKKLIEAIL